MSAKPRITIVGPGNLGTSLAISLHRAGFSIDAVIARSRGSLKKAERLAQQVDSHAATDIADAEGDIIWLCVPDSQIALAAQQLAQKQGWNGRIVFHSSGALTSDELRPFRRTGAAVASVHPLMTFVAGSCPSLANVPFAVEGDPAAVRMARKIVRDLGGLAYPIKKKDKAAYHAWGMFASPLLTALLATTERVAEAAGMRRSEARRRMIPILLQTLANYASFGAPQAFSGPIIRGDVDTVKRHLRVFRGSPVAREVYSALARAAIAYLPTKNKRELRQILKG